MKLYDRTKPLISIHLPKTAGTTFRKNILSEWDCRVLHHYDYHGTNKFTKLPIINLELLDDYQKKPIIVHGHFYKDRCGISEYYPYIDQYITILREPLKAQISLYYFSFKLDCANPEVSLDKWIKHGKPHGLPRFFPEEITLNNYKDIIESNFIEIGIAEKMEESMYRFAKALDMPFDTEWLTVKENVTVYDSSLLSEDLINEFKQKHEIDYAIYNYILSKFN